MSYYARVIEEIKNGEGYWSYNKVGVFRKVDGKEEKVGEYQRNYSSFYKTFCWFTKDGKDYALYSPDYTATRIMELPSCRDLGGEAPDGFGFCPVEFFVPTYRDYECRLDWKGGKKVEPYWNRFRVHEPGEKGMEDSPTFRSLTGLLHHPFGFVAGCVWGDDSSWKIQHLDLSQAHLGLLTRTPKFGYLELPEGLDLKGAIHLQGDDLGNNEYPTIVIDGQIHFNLATGKRFSE